MTTATPTTCGNPTACGAPQAAAHGEPNCSDRDLELLRIASEHFRHDLTVLWTQSGFFALLQGVLVTAYSAAVGPREPGSSSLVEPRVQAAVVAVAAALFCVVWLWSGSIRLRLVEQWHKQVLHLDEVADRHRMYDAIKVPSTGLGAPSSYTLAIPAAGLLGWVVVAALHLFAG